MKKKKIFLVFLLIMIASVYVMSGCTGNNKKTDNNPVEEVWNGISHEGENIIDDKYGTTYQILLYTFCDSDGDGIGDINGLISKLDYIKDLGFDSIWLLPFNQSNTYHKYDVVDYYSVDKEYGTMEDFENLVKECDSRNIDIYMDFVINHTSAKNQWFIDACNYLKELPAGSEPDAKECPYVDYYNFKQATSTPSNYHKVAGTTDWYYECVFWDQMPDLNLDSDAVKKEIENIASFWIDKGIKGFRLDAALHYFEGNPDKSTEALKWFCDYVYSINPDIYCVAEVWDTYTTMAKFYESHIDSIFDYAYGNNDGILCKYVNKYGDGESGSKLSNSTVKLYNIYKEAYGNFVEGIFADNHDTGRIAGFLGRDENRIKIASGIEILSTGHVFIYYGDELGMSGSGKDENKRAPMYWTSDESAQGMTKGPSGYEKQEHSFGSLEDQKDEQYSIYNYYKKAIHIRNTYPSIGRGEPVVMDDVTSQNGNLYAISKTYEDESVCIIFNNSDEEITFTVSKDKYGYEDIADYLTVKEGRPSIDGEEITLPAFAGIVLK